MHRCARHPQDTREEDSPGPPSVGRVELGGDDEQHNPDGHDHDRVPLEPLVHLGVFRRADPGTPEGKEAGQQCRKSGKQHEEKGHESLLSGRVVHFKIDITTYITRRQICSLAVHYSIDC